MRDIKFRAWDTQFKMMSPPIDIFNHGEEFFFFKGIGTRSVNHFRLIIMQYTGLKDKNGKEIYEGDVCKLLNQFHLNEIYSVKFIGGSFCLSNELEPYIPFFAYDKDKIDYMEVIGNIYENPELLESIE
jgi:uncharacterized phage protein (TIGR01671 family)